MSVWQPTEEIKYIKNKQKYGVKIDWNLINKEFNSLDIPTDTHNPLNAELDKIGYYIDLSDRSRGKTTNKLILGLIIYKLYGLEFIYLRQHKNDCTPKMLNDLFKTVLKYGYISKIFDGAFNDVYYIGKRWYLVQRDENGVITDKCENYFCACFGIDENDGLKSTYNSDAVLIFHDEFITSCYCYNDAFRFWDITKTIFRDRVNGIIMLSANTIDVYSQWFEELCIADKVQLMSMGDKCYIQTDAGTRLYVEILPENVSPDREKVNIKYWGFPNDKLTAITGKGKVWATENYPHIPHYHHTNERDKHAPETLLNILFIELMQGKYVKLRLVNDENRGLCVFCTRATTVYDDSIILTTDEIKDRQHIFGLGENTPIYHIFDLYKDNKFYYASNQIGEFVKAYLTKCRDKYRQMLL